MAKYFANAHHEDEVTKRPITTDEINFLAALQKELNTQDGLGAKSPFWVIRDYTKHYGKDINEATGISIYDTDDSLELYEGEFPSSENMEEFLAGIKNTLIEDWDTIDEKEWEHILNRFRNFSGYPDLYVSEDDLEQLVDIINEETPLNLTLLQYIEVPDDKNLFLTHEAAESYLKSNEHHHGDDSFAMGSGTYRSPQIDQLLKILKEVDFNSLTVGGNN